MVLPVGRYAQAILDYTDGSLPAAADALKDGAVPGTRALTPSGRVLTLLSLPVPQWVPGASVGAADFVLYGRINTGSDSASGLKPNEAIKTFAEFKRRVPSQVAGKCRFIALEAGVDAFPPGDFVLPEPINPNDSGNAESLVIDARSALQTTRAGVVVTAASGPFPPLTNSISYAGAPLPRGALVRVATGGGAGQYATVDSTVAGAPNVSLLVLPIVNVAPGDTFDVLTQGYQLDCTTGGRFVAYAGLRGVWNIVAVKFLGGFQAISACGATPLCDFDTQGQGVFPARHWGKWLGGNPGLLPSDLFDPNLFSAALTVHGTDGGGSGGCLGGTTFSEIDAGICADNTALIFERQCALNLFPLNCNNSPLYAMQPANLIAGGVTGILKARASGMLPGFGWNVESQNNEQPITAAIRVAGGGGAMDGTAGTGTAALSGIAVEDNTGYSGVAVAMGAALSLEGVTTDPLAPNSLDGLVVSDGAKAYGDATTTLTGTAAEISLEGDAYTWATLRAAGNNRPNPSALDASGNLLGKGAVSDSRGNVVGTLV